MTAENRQPVFLLAFANDRDDPAHYLRDLSEEARQLRAALVPTECVVLCTTGVPQGQRPAIRLKPFICSGLCIFWCQLLADIDGLQISKNP